MNQRKAKALRRIVSKLDPAEFPLHHVSLSGKSLRHSSQLTAGFGGIITARYPRGSRQETYTRLKRAYYASKRAGEQPRVS